ncbi:polysaccharide biosynthesis tyrosine autokinase [Acaryochloris marina]|uniref:GumC family protein n=1 Tax=Acaryochloris marina TaxID=155978 RepID=UPI001BB07B53|nr:polysaccharide biosynthesis tyrosine autokinase [Acaryochloris marina]QUY40617.1 polysaccharide biosynthesis tyrosine autokinase [Acaryochloris marina S15]
MVTNPLPTPIETNTSVDYWSIFKRRWKPALCFFTGVCVLNTFNTLSKTPIYQAVGQLRLNVPNKTSQLVSIKGIEANSNSDQGISTEIAIMKSHPLLEKTLVSLQDFLKNNNSDTSLKVSTLKASLTITPQEGTDVVNVKFESVAPRIASATVNQLMEVYVNYNLQENRSQASVARQFIAKQLPQIKQNVLVADQSLRRFMEANQISDVESLANVVTSAQINIQNQIDQVATELAKIEAESLSIRGQLGVTIDSAFDISTASQLPAIQKVRDSLQEVSQNLALARTNLTPDHPTILDLEDQQKRLQSILQDTIQTSIGESSKVNQQPVDSTRQKLLNQLVQLNVVRQGLLKQQKVLEAQLNIYGSRSQQLPTLSQKLRQLQRELGVAETTYKALLQSLQNAQLTENQTIPTAKIVELAELPSTPVAPNQFAEILRGVIAGALLAAGLAYFLEKIDSKLKTVDDIRETYPSWPVLGSVPIHTSESEDQVALPTIINPRSPISESYRMLRANLRFLSTEAPVRVLTFSSALPQEGKSWTSANLAVVLSQMNYRVLLIDADLRKPTQHLIWEVSNQTGLSNVLAATEDSDRGTPITHSVQPNLDLLTSGSLPPNPQALIDSNPFHTFVAQQADRYDFVLIDAPPLMAAADALIMAQETDGLILVGRPEYLEKSSAKRAKELLEQSGTAVLGLFINGIVTKNESYSYYYYYSHNYYGDSKSKSGSGTQRSLPSPKDLFLR